MDEDTEMEPALAAAMGFSGFGMQGKKRRYDPNDGFIDPDAKKQAGASLSNPNTGANKMPLGDRSAAKPLRESHADVKFSNSAAATILPQNQCGNENTFNRFQPSPAERPTNLNIGEPTMAQLRRGIVNEAGDTVYFLPSFVEDPWAGLKPST